MKIVRKRDVMRTKDALKDDVVIITNWKKFDGLYLSKDFLENKSDEELLNIIKNIKNEYLKEKD